MTGKAIDFWTNYTVPVINLNPVANLLIFPIIYIMLNGAQGPRNSWKKKISLAALRENFDLSYLFVITYPLTGHLNNIKG